MQTNLLALNASIILRARRAHRAQVFCGSRRSASWPNARSVPIRVSRTPCNPSTAMCSAGVCLHQKSHGHGRAQPAGDWPLLAEAEQYPRRCRTRAATGARAALASPLPSNQTTQDVMVRLNEVFASLGATNKPPCCLQQQAGRLSQSSLNLEQAARAFPYRLSVMNRLASRVKVVLLWPAFPRCRKGFFINGLPPMPQCPVASQPAPDGVIVRRARANGAPAWNSGVFDADLVFSPLGIGRTAGRWPAGLLACPRWPTSRRPKPPALCPHHPHGV